MFKLCSTINLTEGGKIWIFWYCKFVKSCWTEYGTTWSSKVSKSYTVESDFLIRESKIHNHIKVKIQVKLIIFALFCVWMIENKTLKSKSNKKRCNKFPLQWDKWIRTRCLVWMCFFLFRQRGSILCWSSSNKMLLVSLINNEKVPILQ